MSRPWRGQVEPLKSVLSREIDGTIITRAEHHPSCEGDCRNCPIPVQDYGSISDLASAVLASPWLAAYVAAARAEAWDQGWRQGAGDAWQNGGHESKPNPYREDLRPCEGA